MQHAPITTPITDKLASMTWIRWFRQLVDRVEEIKGTTDAPGWETITGKPTEFPPSEHRHEWTDLDAVPTEFPPEPHTHSIGDLSDVSLSTPSGNDTLIFVGGEWVNTPSVKIFTQATPAATWGPFVHPYGRPVSVETIDSLGNEFDAGIVQNHPDYTTVTVTLGAATTGRVIIY